MSGATAWVAVAPSGPLVATRGSASSHHVGVRAAVAPSEFEVITSTGTTDSSRAVLSTVAATVVLAARRGTRTRQKRTGNFRGALRATTTTTITTTTTTTGGDAAGGRTAVAPATMKPQPGSVGAVLLSGGVGKRMGAKIPKQYLKLCDHEIALHALDVLLNCPSISEVVIVVADEWKSLFADHAAKRMVTDKIKYTTGGAERQDSVRNGLAKITCDYAAIHDAARPLVTVPEIEKAIVDAFKYGAALLGVGTKATIKVAETNADGVSLVASTPNRKTMWEAHTPQVIRSKILRDGFANQKAKNLEVTDDVSLVEALGLPVKLTEGEYTNIKVTTPEDMAVATAILRSRGSSG